MGKNDLLHAPIDLLIARICDFQSPCKQPSKSKSLMAPKKARFSSEG